MSFTQRFFMLVSLSGRGSGYGQFDKYYFDQTVFSHT